MAIIDTYFDDKLERYPKLAAIDITDGIRCLVNNLYPTRTMTKEQWKEILPFVMNEMNSPTSVEDAAKMDAEFMAHLHDTDYEFGTDSSTDADGGLTDTTTGD